MKRGTKILLGLAIVGVLYFTYKKVKKKGFLLKADDLANNDIFVDLVDNDIVFTDSNDNEVGEYQSTGRNMEYPLLDTGSPYTAYDNVAKLQTYLVFANEDIELEIDGIYGPNTADVVFSELNNITGYGYDADDYDYSEVTQQYYNEVVLPNLEFFLNEE